MPRTRSLAWSELKIGLMSIFALVVATAFIFLLTGSNGFFWQRYSIKTVFPDVAGLKEGAPVRVAGVEVGTVTGVEFVGDRVEVLMEVLKENRPRITSTSIATLGSVSLLGEAAVDITASSGGMTIQDWGYVPSRRASGSLSSVADSANASIEEATALMKDLRAGKGTLGRLFTDEQLYKELIGLVSSAEQVANTMNQGRGTIGRLMNNPAAARSLENSLDNLQAVTARIRAGEGSLGKLLNDDSLATSLKSATGNLDAFTGRINRGEGTLGKLATDQELYNRLNSVSDRLDKVVGALQQGEGTAGQLLHDKQLYENMNGTMVEIRDLVAAIKKDPKRYLNVRVSLF
jgi:phospholipid/cholesterol/gamma-HCH transport system substrate-binding protein